MIPAHFSDPIVFGQRNNHIATNFWEDKMASIYSEIMDTKVNSLKRLPTAQRFQIMVYLSMMWTTIFCLGTGAWLWYGHLIIAHVGVALGVAVTSWTFFTVRHNKTYRDFPESDGTARYDDVWGG